MEKHRSSRRVLSIFVSIVVLFSLFTTTVAAAPSSAPAEQVTFTILHTNDFHGQLEASGSNPGMARVAAVVNNIRNTVGSQNVLLLDAGDEMQGSLLSNLQHGFPVIEVYKAMGYGAATFGNHEFDWGQTNLIDRVTQASEVYPYVSANIVSGSCDTENWTSPSFASPYVIKTVGTDPNQVKVGIIGVTTTETPTITIATATAGLCFKDPATSILHYYDAMKADGADVIVVLSHLGFNDGGYGYGIPVYGDKTLAQKLIDAGRPVSLIIGGHSHTSFLTLTPPAPSGVLVGQTLITQAYYNGRQVGRADITVQPGGAVSVAWQTLAVSTSGAKDLTIDTLITQYANDPTYKDLINQPIGYSAVDLPRLGGTVDNMMGTFVDDAIYNYLNTDNTPDNDIDIFFNNAGGIRTDWCWNGSDWVNIGCVSSTHAAGLLTYGDMFTILPFGNATVVGDMTGAQILEVLNKAPQVINGVIQPAGLNYKYYAYRDANPGPQPFAWGAFDYCVVNKTTHECDPLNMNKTYRVGTNEFLAPGGGDNYGGFKYMTNISYWGDMLNAVDAWVTANYGTAATAYMGPNGDGSLDGRILRDGTDAMGSGSIIPITILHHNDSHGNLAKGAYVGYTQLATVIKQERLHNPDRTLLLDGGDQIQGDAMMYYFKSSYSGFAADGTPLPANLQTNPMIAVMNSLGYDAMVLGNHEFNFGSAVFTGIFKQAQFPLLGANVSDTGAYGLSQVGPGGQGVQPYLEETVGGIKIAILGITNHRVPNYELPSNIVGLTFSNPITTGQQFAPQLKANNDVVIALTHIGFTTNPKSVEVDENVDTNFAAQVPGVDAIVGAHSHTNPASPEAPYKQLPTYVGGPSNTPVIINQAYRYNNTLGEIIIGVRAKAGGGYEVVSRAGEYISVTSSTTVDAATKAIVDPYVDALDTYNKTPSGQTTVPIDTTNAYIAETNAANLQADAAVYELEIKNKIPVDFHLSGAMTRPSLAYWIMFPTATAATPAQMKISDMFTLMPYENSLVVISMNGPQLKAVLERAYRNYYYYKYVPGYGGYSYYTTCMLDTNKGNQITYNDLSPALPNGHNVVSLVIGGVPVDFSDASTYYRVSTVNYLAAGSCNFNDGGVTLWPLSKIVKDTQYYVRDAVIDYVTAEGTVSPKIEGRLSFITDATLPTITKVVGLPQYVSGSSTFVTSSTSLTINVADAGSGFRSCSISITGPGGVTTPPCIAGDNILTLSGPDGTYTIQVTAVDMAWNTATFNETDILDNSSPLLTKTIGDPKFTTGGNTYVKSSTSISVAAADGTGSGIAGCTLSIDGGAANSYTGGNFSLPPSDGVHTLSVMCTDNLGNSRTLDETDRVDDTAPVITIVAPTARAYLHPDFLTIQFSAVDTGSGVKTLTATLDGKPVKNGQVIDLYKLSLKSHTLTVKASDNIGNQTEATVTFSVEATIDSLIASVERFTADKQIDRRTAKLLITKLENIQKLMDKDKGKDKDKDKDKSAIKELEHFIDDVQHLDKKDISKKAADLLIADARYVIAHLK